MDLVKADEKGLLYQTSDVKDLWGQVVKSRKVEACFNDLQANIQIRITGFVEIIEDQSVKEEIVAKETLSEAPGGKARIRVPSRYSW